MSFLQNSNFIEYTTSGSRAMREGRTIQQQKKSLHKIILSNSIKYKKKYKASVYK